MNINRHMIKKGIAILVFTVSEVLYLLEVALGKGAVIELCLR